MEILNMVLRPLSEDEMCMITLKMVEFFSPMNNAKIREALSLPPIEKVMPPLSVFNFITYLEKENIINKPLEYIYHIMALAHKLASQGILIPAGTSGNAPGLDLCYLCIKPLTDLQSGANYWLSSILGERYLRSLASKYIVRIEGENAEGKWGTGSGVFISPGIILTCAHNILDMEIKSCWIGDNSLEIISMQTHEKYDVGIIKVSDACLDEAYPYFGPPLVLDKTLTLGYPPLRGIREPQLLAQSGEINAIGSETFTGCECITISSITRPGNSGGPVFSMQGYIVGIVISSACSVDSFGAQECGGDGNHEGKELPFYLAISSNSLRDIVAEIDSSIGIRFEEFQ